MLLEMKGHGGIYKAPIQLSGRVIIGRNSMNESLIIAYDLKHQIESLPDHFKKDTKVDRVETEHDMLSKISIVIHALEAYQRDIK
jgi:hypothetical protein